ncbi:MAG TPA: alpha/beta hydrolase-fold protein [Pirellulales bacterium]|nr:alpha/beta hydrolase-fold protein [Pirellulales bacterium]
MTDHSELASAGQATGWSTVSVAGKPCDAFQPSSPHPHGFVVIYLHGVHQNRLSDKPAFTAEFARHGLRVIAPLTGRSWWTDRICPEFDEQITAHRHVTDNVLRYVAAAWNAAPPQIALLGTSMGGQGALRLAFKHPSIFPVTAAISPAIDYHLRWNEGDETLPQMYVDQEAARQDTATLHVHPLNWPRHVWFCCDPSDRRWHESAERLHSKLVALGIGHDYDLETSGGGHGFEYYNRMTPAAMQFIVDRLERERLRVV